MDSAQIVGPVDPAFVGQSFRLAPPESFEHWRSRALNRLRNRLAEEDFAATWEAVLRWLDGRAIGIEQVYCSVVDIFIAMAGVHPAVVVQQCEETDIVMLSVVVADARGKRLHARSRCIDIRQPQAA